MTFDNVNGRTDVNDPKSEKIRQLQLLLSELGDDATKVIEESKQFEQMKKTNVELVKTAINQLRELLKPYSINITSIYDQTTGYLTELYSGNIHPAKVEEIVAKPRSKRVPIDEKIWPEFIATFKSSEAYPMSSIIEKFNSLYPNVKWMSYKIKYWEDSVKSGLIKKIGTGVNMSYQFLNKTAPTDGKMKNTKKG